MKRAALLFVFLAGTAMASAIVASYFAQKHTTQAMSKELARMEVSNAVGRFEHWERMENLLIKGCNKEALEFSKTLQSSELSFIAMYLERDPSLREVLQERSPGIEAKVASFEGAGASFIPTCE